MSTIASELDRRAKVIGGKAWGADKGKPRIYMNLGRKDISAYFAFPDAKLDGDAKDWDEFTGLGGSRFCVYIDDCGQSADWYASEKSKIRERFRGKALALLAIEHGDDELANRFAEADEIDEKLFDQLHRDLSDGKIEEAKAAFDAGGVF